MCAQSQCPNSGIWLSNQPTKHFTVEDGTPVKCITTSGDRATLLTPEKETIDLVSKKTYPFQGRQVPGQSVEFEMTAEPWFHYKLADGSDMKIKIVLIDVVRLDEYNDQGDPVYHFNLQNIITVTVPDELKRKKQ